MPNLMVLFIVHSLKLGRDGATHESFKFLMIIKLLVSSGHTSGVFQENKKESIICGEIAASLSTKKPQNFPLMPRGKFVSLNYEERISLGLLRYTPRDPSSSIDTSGSETTTTVVWYKLNLVNTARQRRQSSMFCDGLRNGEIVEPIWEIPSCNGFQLNQISRDLSKYAGN